MTGLLLAVATTAIALVVAPGAARCGTVVSAENVNSAVLIMTGTGEAAHPVGAGFFVSVPSRRFAGSSFFYLVTARHNLFDAQGRPRSGLWLYVPHRTGKSRERLPTANDWFFSQSDAKIDLAALPYSPPAAAISAVAVRMMNGPDESGVAPQQLLGADAYYISYLSRATGAHSPIAALHFGWVSIAAPIPAATGGAGIQHLLFVEGVAEPGMSGAPIFVDRNGSRLLGMVEADTTINATAGAERLIGVMPAAPIARLTTAMAAAQDRKRATDSR